MKIPIQINLLKFKENGFYKDFFLESYKPNVIYWINKLVIYDK